MKIDDLIDYISDNENQQRFRCKVCGQRFIEIKLCEDHIMKHLEEYNRIREIMKAVDNAGLNGDIV